MQPRALKVLQCADSKRSPPSGAQRFHCPYQCLPGCTTSGRSAISTRPPSCLDLKFHFQEIPSFVVLGATCSPHTIPKPLTSPCGVPQASRWWCCLYIEQGSDRPATLGLGYPSLSWGRPSQVGFQSPFRCAIMRALIGGRHTLPGRTPLSEPLTMLPQGTTANQHITNSRWSSNGRQLNGTSQACPPPGDAACAGRACGQPEPPFPRAPPPAPNSTFCKLLAIPLQTICIQSAPDKRAHGTGFPFTAHQLVNMCPPRTSL